MKQTYFLFLLFCFSYFISLSQDPNFDPFDYENYFIKEKKIKKITEKDSSDAISQIANYDKQGNVYSHYQYWENHYMDFKTSYGKDDQVVKEDVTGYEYFKLLDSRVFYNTKNQIDSIDYDQIIPNLSLAGFVEKYHYRTDGKIDLITVYNKILERSDIRNIEYLKKQYNYSSNNQLESITTLLIYEQDEKRIEIPIFNTFYSYFSNGSKQSELKKTVKEDTLLFKIVDANGLLTDKYENFTFSKLERHMDFSHAYESVIWEKETNFNDLWQINIFLKRNRSFLNDAFINTYPETKSEMNNEYDHDDLDSEDELYNKFPLSHTSYLYENEKLDQILFKVSLMKIPGQKFLYDKNGQLYSIINPSDQKEINKILTISDKNPSIVHYQIKNANQNAYTEILENNNSLNGESKLTIEGFSEKFHCTTISDFDSLKNCVSKIKNCNEGSEQITIACFDASGDHMISKTTKYNRLKKENDTFGENEETPENYEDPESQETSKEYKEYFRYDKAGNCITQNETEVSNYHYKDSVLLKKEIYEDATKTQLSEIHTFQYGSNGYLSNHTSIVYNRDDSIRTEYQYAPNGKVLKYKSNAEYGPQNLIYTYDEKWNLVKISGKESDEDNEFDEFNTTYIDYNEQNVCTKIKWSFDRNEEHEHPETSIYIYEYWE